MPEPTVAEVIGMIKDGVLALAGFGGTIIAWRGLRTWNRQLTGGVQYELTRRLLKCTYRLREAIEEVRDPIMSTSEQVLSEKEQQLLLEVQRYLGTANAYLKRWENVTTVRTDIQAEQLEAEALWGKEVHEKFSPLLKLHHELFRNIRSFLAHSDPRSTEEQRDAWFQVRQEQRDVLYDISGPGDYRDPYTDDMEKAIKEIESYLKPRLAQ